MKERCLRLLQSPSTRAAQQELKYLVIDYTQFDEWSSDEEYEIVTGIEPGYESWEGYSSDEAEDQGEPAASAGAAADNPQQQAIEERKDEMD